MSEKGLGVAQRQSQREEEKGGGGLGGGVGAQFYNRQHKYQGEKSRCRGSRGEGRLWTPCPQRKLCQRGRSLGEGEQLPPSCFLSWLCMSGLAAASAPPGRGMAAARVVGRKKEVFV